MNLFFQPNIQDGNLTLEGDEAHHAIKSLRVKKGDLLNLTDGKGFFYQAQISESDHRSCSFKIISSSAAPKKDYSIHIAIAPTKNIDRIEWFTEKAIELGIEKISFILCQNSERKNINIERIQKLAINAMKQSGQAWLPQINALQSFDVLLEETNEQKFIAYVDRENSDHLKSLALTSKTYLVMIGPEGDFSKQELDKAIQKGFQKVSLGNNRLRTETAGLAACHILNLINL